MKSNFLKRRLLGQLKEAESSRLWSKQMLTPQISFSCLGAFRILASSAYKREISKSEFYYLQYYECQEPDIEASP